MAERTKFCVIAPVVVDRLHLMVESQARIMGTCGISWNTWKKVRSGEPIRLSVALRLLSRVTAGDRGQDPMAHLTLV